MPDSLQVQLGRLRFQHTAVIRPKLAELYSAATANKMIAALRGCLRATWRLGQMSSDDYQRAIDIDRIEGDTLPAGRALTTGEIAALLDACVKDQSVAGIRDAAMSISGYIP